MIGMGMACWGSEVVGTVGRDVEHGLCGEGIFCDRSSVMGGMMYVACLSH